MNSASDASLMNSFQELVCTFGICLQTLWHRRLLNPTGCGHERKHIPCLGLCTMQQLAVVQAQQEDCSRSVRPGPYAAWDNSFTSSRASQCMWNRKVAVKNSNARRMVWIVRHDVFERAFDIPAVMENFARYLALFIFIWRNGNYIYLEALFTTSIPWFHRR